MQNFLEIETKYSFNVYSKRDIVLVRGENATVWDHTGKSYIDCVCGHGVANLGHANKAVVEAISRQAKKLITCSNVYYNDSRATLLQKLIEITPRNLTRAFLCNSGTESIEAALKFTRFTTRKTDFICAVSGFHGRTFGAMSATFKSEYKQPYEPVVPGFSFAPFNDYDQLRNLVTDKTAGIILEPVQGEGGINPGKKAYFDQVRKLCNERGIILIIDEIQTGFCRTGKMFACEYFDIRPDILCLAKALAGGIPMGAAVCSDKIEVPVGKHGTTFGGNPLSCAAASAAINVMVKDDLPGQALQKGEYFREKLSQYELTKVREIRGLGLMIGIELNEAAQPVIGRLLEDGLLVFPAGANVLRVFPPLTIEYDQLDQVVEILTRILK